MKRLSFSAFSFFVAVSFFGLSGNLEAQSDWKKQWEKTVEAAKKEGEVVIYGPHNPNYRPVWSLFQKSFPEIKFNFVGGRGAEHAERILAERRAGKYIVDLVMGGSSTYASYPSGTLEPIRPLLVLPEVSDESVWWGEKLSFSDPQNQLVLIVTGEVGTRRGSYNTKLVTPQEIQSWRDLLKPKWKGKLGCFDPRVSGGGGETFAFFYHTPALGPDFIKRLLTETDMILTRDLVQGTDWLAKGKILFYIGSAQPIMRAKEQGLPVDLLPHPMQEGEIMGGGSCCLAYLNRAPHPNAAKVFINWVLSREGQGAWQKHLETNSLRTDIPKSDLPPILVPIKGVRYFMLNSSQYNSPAMIKTVRSLVNEVLEERKKQR
ncbi:MAG: ABC transporter substrate-binding protein [Candidatus Binatia bacterium]